MDSLPFLKTLRDTIDTEITRISQPEPNPEPEPPVVVDPPVVVAPPPAQPKPPVPVDVNDLVDGLATGVTPCGAQTPGVDVARCTLPGVTVSATQVLIGAHLDKFEGWNIGSRRLVFNARVGRFADFTSIGGNSGPNPLIQIMPGGGFDEAEFVTVLDCAGSMIFKQENGGVAGLIRRWDARGMSQDAFKVSEACILEENLIADATYHGGAPHSDAFTVMAARGGVTIRNNNVDWNYANQAAQTGINNLFRIEPYPAASREFDDVVIEGNALRHANDRSFGIQVAEKNSPTWRGSVKVRNNRFAKAGGNRKILYAPSKRISEWVGNTDFAGADIPLAAA